MRTMLSGLVVAIAMVAQGYAGPPAGTNGAVPARPASPVVAAWYYIPSGWYLLVPAGPNAPVPSAVATAAAAVAMPAGLPAASPTGPSPVITSLYAAPSNVAPYSWQHDHQNDNQWPADHGG